MIAHLVLATSLLQSHRVSTLPSEFFSPSPSCTLPAEEKGSDTHRECRRRARSSGKVGSAAKTKFNAVENDHGAALISALSGKTGEDFVAATPSRSATRTPSAAKTGAGGSTAQSPAAERSTAKVALSTVAAKTVDGDDDESILSSEEEQPKGLFAPSRDSSDTVNINSSMNSRLSGRRDVLGGEGETRGNAAPPLWTVWDKAYVVGAAGVFIFGELVHPRMFGEGAMPFLPLMGMSVLGAIGVLACWVLSLKGVLTAL